MINDDRLIFHTLDHWDFGPSDTGDILDRDNRVEMVANIKRKLQDRVDLVTADGSVDCQGNPADQVGKENISNWNIKSFLITIELSIWNVSYSDTFIKLELFHYCFVTYRSLNIDFDIAKVSMEIIFF